MTISTWRPFDDDDGECPMPTEPVFTITYWGVTGTLSAPLRGPQMTARIVQTLEHLIKGGRLASLSPGPQLRATLEREVAALPFHLRSTYGGNTTCVEVRTPDALLILDCGSGFRELGLALQKRWDALDYRGSRHAHVLVTHPHMDHTYGTPYFTPYYDPRNNFTIWGTRSVLDSLEAVLSPSSPMSHTYFPPTFDMLRAIRRREEVQPGQEFAIGQTRITTCALHHPGGCMAFRLENAGRVFVFA